MNKETWKGVPGYLGLYEVSNLGRFRSLGRVCNAKNGSQQNKKKRILTQEITIHGYCRVRLYDQDGNAKHFAVHRLVMTAFRENLDLQVNHINEIKTDNRLSNLEYVSEADNCNHGTRNTRISESVRGKGSRRVAQIGDDGSVVATYESRTAAAQATGIDAGHIGSCCRGARAKAGGYKWRNV